MKVTDKKNKNHDVINNQESNISIWQIFGGFIIANLIIINIINYWQPINNKGILVQYNQTQNAMLSAYDLQRYFNEFKTNPDNNAYIIIQKSVKLANSIEQLENNSETQLNTTAVSLNQNIEQISKKVPSLRGYQQQIDKILKINKTLKQLNLDNLDTIKSNPIFAINNNISNNIRMQRRTDTNHIAGLFLLTKNLITTEDKIDNLLQTLKHDYWLTDSSVAKYQNIIEEIGLEIEQINTYIESGNLTANVNTSIIIANLNELFNGLNQLMPMLLELTDTNTKLNMAEKYLNTVIADLGASETALNNAMKQGNIFDDKTLIILTLIGASILLSILILLAKATDKTKKVYKEYKNKQDIYLLSHNKPNKPASQPETNKERSEVQELEPIE